MKNAHQKKGSISFSCESQNFEEQKHNIIAQNILKDMLMIP
jgi:hypothetical protein